MYQRMFVYLALGDLLICTTNTVLPKKYKYGDIFKYIFPKRRYEARMLKDFSIVVHFRFTSIYFYRPGGPKIKLCLLKQFSDNNLKSASLNASYIYVCMYIMFLHLLFTDEGVTGDIIFI